MKITICGSIAFYDEMLNAKKQLEQHGHDVKLPPIEVPDEKGILIPVKKYYEIRKTETKEDSWVWNRKNEAIKNHFDKIAWSDAVLVLNYEKNNVPGYIGANTLMEMGVALHLNKLIFLLKRMPEISYKEEILGMKTICIDGDLTKIH